MLFNVRNNGRKWHGLCRAKADKPIADLRPRTPAAELPPSSVLRPIRLDTTGPIPSPPLPLGVGALGVGPVESSYGVWGSAVSSPSGVWGEAPADDDFGAI